MQIENGIHDNISIRDYHANTSHISATSIKQAKVSLKQYNWFRSGKMPRTQALHLDFGNAFELALLDKVGFTNEVAIMQDEYWIALANEERTKDGKEPYKSPKQSARYQAELSKFLEQNNGRYMIPQKGEQSYEAIEYMLESCYSDETIKKLISGTEYQLSLFWTDPQTGVNLKTRPDICKRKKNVVVNLKTANDASPKAFSKDLVSYDYPLQACVEISGCLETGLMDDVDNYFWLVVEKNPPYNAVIYEFDKADIKVCMDEYDYLIHQIAEANTKNEWPGYQAKADNVHGILQAKIPTYYFNF